MAYIIRMKFGNSKKWVTNPNPHKTMASAKRLVERMKREQHGPHGEFVKLETKIVKVDMRKSKSSLQWIPK